MQRLPVSARLSQRVVGGGRLTMGMVMMMLFGSDGFAFGLEVEALIGSGE